MAIELIDIGNIANDGTGDDLRTAFEKVNLNFVELDTSIDISTTASNIGNGVGIFKQKSGNNLEFRSLETDANLAVTVVGDKIRIATDFAGKDISVGSLTTIGGAFIGTTLDAGIITASSIIGSFVGTVYPPGPARIIGIGNIDGFNPAYGTVGYEPAKVDGISVQDLYRQVNTIDLGSITGTFTDPISYLLNQVGIDMGTFTSPASFVIDGGSL
jgi:hypothetical protein